VSESVGWVWENWNETLTVLAAQSPSTLMYSTWNKKVREWEKEEEDRYIRESRAKQAREIWLQIDSEIRECTYRRKWKRTSETDDMAAKEDQ